MTVATTMLHVYGYGPDEVEHALDAIFASEERPRVLRLQGTYSAVLAHALAPELDAGYRYVLLRPRPGSAWTPLLELGNRTDGLDRALSAALGGAAIFAIFTYGAAVSGYRMARGGVEIDRYISDPEYFVSHEADEAEADEATPEGASVIPDLSPVALEAVRGQPERFAALLPSGTDPQDFARIVLQPGWWERHTAGALTTAIPTSDEESEEDEELVDEGDRMRCIGLALELWTPSEYPFAGELEDIANNAVGPAIALAYA